MHDSSKKNKRKKGWIRFIRSALLLIFVLNLAIFIFGKQYLYKGIRYTYLRGKDSPTIYDSLVFPVRVAKASKNPEDWNSRKPLITLSSDDIARLNSTNTTSFLIVKDDKIIAERYFGDHTINTKSNSFSAAKSVVALLIGIAVDEGKIKSIDDPVQKYLPYHMKNADKVTIRDVMGMSSGLDWSESGINPFSDNAEAYYTSHLRYMMKTKGFTAAAPGKKFNYKSGNTEVLGIILEEATGMSPTEYLEKKIWSKIGTKNNLEWSLDTKDGMEKTFCCIYATTRDYARLGQLVLNHGQWKGKKIIDSTTLATLVHPFNPNYPFYGLQFWIYNDPVHPAVYFRGIKGQYIVVIPSLNVVIVRTGHERKRKYKIPKDERNNSNFVRKNKYKENHPLDLTDYYTILKNVLKKDQ